MPEGEKPVSQQDDLYKKIEGASRESGRKTERKKENESTAENQDSSQTE
jgi:hypothetical protein